VCCSVLQCVVVCCSVLQRVAACYSVLQCVAACCSVLQCVTVCCSVLQCAAVCCSVLRCVAVCCSVLQCVAALVSSNSNPLIGSRSSQVRCSVVQCVAVCCSVLQSVAVCCSVLQRVAACCSAFTMCCRWAPLGRHRVTFSKGLLNSFTTDNYHSANNSQKTSAIGATFWKALYILKRALPILNSPKSSILWEFGGCCAPAENDFQNQIW